MHVLAAFGSQAFFRTFGRYLPDKIAALPLANQGTVQPRLATATILYLDIADFIGTPCERPDPSRWMKRRETP